MNSNDWQRVIESVTGLENALFDISSDEVRGKSREHCNVTNKKPKDEYRAAILAEIELPDISAGDPSYSGFEGGGLTQGTSPQVNQDELHDKDPAPTKDEQLDQMLQREIEMLQNESKTTAPQKVIEQKQTQEMQEKLPQKGMWCLR